VDLEGLAKARDLDGKVGRIIGLAWRATDPRAASFHDLSRFLRDTAPPGTQAA
jgi:LysR family hydrogen peroxide-inducible transcriptional activator